MGMWGLAVFASHVWGCVFLGLLTGTALTRATTIWITSVAHSKWKAVAVLGGGCVLGPPPPTLFDPKLQLMWVCWTQTWWGPVVDPWSRGQHWQPPDTASGPQPSLQVLLSAEEWLLEPVAVSLQFLLNHGLPTCEALWKHKPWLYPQELIPLFNLSCLWCKLLLTAWQGMCQLTEQGVWWQKQCAVLWKNYYCCLCFQSQSWASALYFTDSKTIITGCCLCCETLY